MTDSKPNSKSTTAKATNAKPKAKSTAAAKNKTTTTAKGKSKAKTTGKKLTVQLDTETMEMLKAYLDEYGFSTDEFVKKAILEKISREKISSMIDTMIKL